MTEIFAVYEVYNDHEIGRVFQAVEDIGTLDNTLVISVNGSKARPRGRTSRLLVHQGISEMQGANLLQLQSPSVK